MDALPLVLALLALTGVVFSAPTVTISVDVDTTSGPITAGTNIKITCQATEVNLLAIVELLEDIPQKREKVATLQRVESGYSSRKAAGGANRYVAQYTYDQDTQMGTMQVDITGIFAEDSGKFLCMLKVGTTEISSDTITIKIKTPVISVSMGMVYPNGTVERVADDSVVNFSTGTSDGVACIVSIASYVINPVENVTVNGGPFSQVNLARTGGTPKPSEGDTAVYEYINKYTTSEPHYSLDNSVVTCKAYAEGFESEIKTAQVRGNATYKPVIVCENIRPKAVEGGSAKVTCNVFAKPAATSVKYNFGMILTDNSERVPFGVTVYLTKYTFEREGDATNSTVSFTISGMTAALFDDYAYQLQATSSLGTTVKKFSFEKVGTVSGGSRSSTSLVLMGLLSTGLICLKTMLYLL